MSKLPSAKELAPRSVGVILSEDVEKIREFRDAVLEAAAEVADSFIPPEARGVDTGTIHRSGTAKKIAAHIRKLKEEL